ncbi:outer membrane protein TolC [Gillisia mitskevichiae]|uniref:Outer membrane protein TolC n=1 Tax=Gillisia mitskevichiae TaxID=270921 RepID=A0A495PYT3_9FLAO|nr:TolC family protein [Gillisia mitskevichiae]RKS55801.1 outer membrane protein TolC [Gillisia mitskevichiae]
MKKIFFIIFLQLAAFAQAQEENATTQKSFTLEEAIEYGLQNSYNSEIAQQDVAIALKQKWEIIAQGLPQISGNAEYRNNLKQPVTLIPGEIAGGDPGTFVPVTFGTKQNLTATTTWNQLIFDGSYIVGVQSAKTLLQISENAKVKTDLSVKEAITNAYGNVLLARESVEIAKRNLETIEKNLNDTRVTYENGLIEEEAVEQLEMTLLGLQTSLNNAERMEVIAYDMLKVSMGIPVVTPIIAVNNLEQLSTEYFDLQLLNKEIPVEENIDYRIAKDQSNQAEILVKLEKSKALPTLSAFVNYGAQANSETFSFFSNNQVYYDQSVLGLSLNVPIFSSGLRSARTAQKKIQYEQSLVQLELTKNQVELNIQSAKNDYKFSLENYANKEKSLDLASRIENKNQIKFLEGLSSSFELSEAQQQLYRAQQDYLQAMLEVITSKIDLENLLDTTKYSKEN